MLKRRFESQDGLSVYWQIVWPSSLKIGFLRLAHGGMTGGHFGWRRSAASIQARAYWPSWSTDLDAFLRQCETCVRYSSNVVPRRGRICSLDVEDLVASRPRAQNYTQVTGCGFGGVIHPSQPSGRRDIPGPNL